MADLSAVAEAVAAATGHSLDSASAQSVGGGCINAAWRLQTADGPVFLKTHSANCLGMFEAECAGLDALARAKGLRVPRVLGCGDTQDQSWLMLEWIDNGPATADSERQLGRGLAAQHRASAAGFGWDRDNWIGATPQENAWTADWCAFFANHRLTVQLDLIETTGVAGRLVAPGRRLTEGVSALLAGHTPQPALLHGDLWGGNWGCDADGAPFLFDPAVYYGDREADLAMTRLFGGFGPDFYAAYEEAWPLSPGAGLRSDLYNLYHVLNHVNLFGAGYAGQAEGIIRRLLAEFSG